MDPQTKGELASAGAKLGIPVASTGLRMLFERRAFEAKKEYVMQTEEQRRQNLKRLAHNMKPAEPEVAVPPENDIEALYSRIAELQFETHCSFCEDVLGVLMHQDPRTARTGLEEIAQLEAEKKRLREYGASSEEIEERLDSLIDEWEVVPALLM